MILNKIRFDGHAGKPWFCLLSNISTFLINEWWVNYSDFRTPTYTDIKKLGTALMAKFVPEYREIVIAQNPLQTLSHDTLMFSVYS